MCGGAPKGQTELAKAQTNLFNQEAAQQAQLFAEDEALAKEIQSIYGPIFNKGPNQLGFSQEERDNLNSTAATGVGQNFAAANTALKETLGAQGGGNTMLPSGVLTKAEEGVTTAGAAQLSSEQNQILQADYGQGYNEFEAATNALLGVGNVFSNSINASNAANSGGAAANQTYHDIAAENQSPWSAVLGALGGVAGAAGTAFGGWETAHKTS